MEVGSFHPVEDSSTSTLARLRNVFHNSLFKAANIDHLVATQGFGGHNGLFAQAAHQDDERREGGHFDHELQAVGTTVAPPQPLNITIPTEAERARVRVLRSMRVFIFHLCLPKNTLVY